MADPLANPAEHRSTPRRPTRFKVMCEVAGRTFEMQAANISRGGIMLLAPELLKVGTMVKLTLDLGDRGEIQMNGLIRHALVEKGLGVEFVELSTQEQQRLSEYLASLPPNS